MRSTEMPTKEILARIHRVASIIEKDVKIIDISQKAKEIQSLVDLIKEK
jgi:hypothetical protein